MQAIRVISLGSDAHQESCICIQRKGWWTSFHTLYSKQYRMGFESDLFIEGCSASCWTSCQISLLNIIRDLHTSKNINLNNSCLQIMLSTRMYEKWQLTFILIMRIINCEERCLTLKTFCKAEWGWFVISKYQAYINLTY